MSDDNETPGENGGNDDRHEFIFSRIEDLHDLVMLRYEDLSSSDAANEVFMMLLAFCGTMLNGPFPEPLKTEMEVWHEINAEAMAATVREERPPLNALKFERPKKGA